MNVVWEQRKRSIEHSIRRARRFFPYKKAILLLILVVLAGSAAYIFMNKPTVLSNIIGKPVSVEWGKEPLATLEDMSGWEVQKSFPGSLGGRDINTATLRYKNGDAKIISFYQNTDYVDIDGQIYSYNSNPQDNILHKIAVIIPW